MDPDSSSATDVCRALQAQTAPSRRNIKSICKYISPHIKKLSILLSLLVNTLSVQCMVYPTAATTFFGLIHQARQFDTIKDSEDPIALTMMYNPNAAPKYGSFKRALFGHLSHAVFAGSTSVCIKQCWYLCKVSGHQLLYDNHTQITKLSAEINCMRWASALMGIVYDFVEKSIARYGEPPFVIPNMRFMKNALIIADSTREAYMVEEVIDEGADVMFVKYIGNNSVKPFDFISGEAANRAQFLTFPQHVQYMKTKNLAFIGDFQGKFLVT